MTVYPDSRTYNTTMQHYASCPDYRAREGVRRDTILMSSLPRENQLKWELAITKLREWAETMPGECLREESCQQAVVFAELLSQDGQPYPTRVGITNDLGIAFEWSTASDSVHMEIIDARYAELTEFRGTELVADEDLEWDSRRQVYIAK